MKLLGAVVLILAILAIDVELFSQQEKEVPKAPEWCDIQVIPNQVVVVLRKEAPKGDQIVVRIYYLAKVAGIERPIMRVSEKIAPYLIDAPVGVDGPADPAAVQTVHLDVISIGGRMEWNQKPPEDKK